MDTIGKKTFLLIIVCTVLHVLYMYVIHVRVANCYYLPQSSCCVDGPSPVPVCCVDGPSPVPAPASGGRESSDTVDSDLSIITCSGTCTCTCTYMYI